MTGNHELTEIDLRTGRILSEMPGNMPLIPFLYHTQRICNWEGSVATGRRKVNFLTMLN